MTDYTRDHWQVGQEVYIRDVNERRLYRSGDGLPPIGTVVKVARKLITVKGPWGREETYEIATGSRSDAYRHGWVQTMEDYEAQQERFDLLRRLKDAGLEVRTGGRPLRNETLRSVIRALESDA